MARQDIQLTRIVRPRLVLRDGEPVVVEEVKTLCIKFYDRNGDNVSLAFDGRALISQDSGPDRVEDYSVFTDCPLMGDMPPGERVRSGPTVAVVRELRDMLNKLDLD